MRISLGHETNRSRRVFRIRLLAAFCCLCIAAGCALAAADEAPTDAMIYDRVIRALVNDRDLKTNQLTVTVKEAVVTVTGQVHTKKLQRRVSKVVKDTKGVKDVINEVIVR